MMGVLRVLTCLLLCAVAGVAAADMTVEQRLRLHLGSAYDSSSMPPGGVTTVALRLSVTRVNLVEAEEAMEVDAWVMTKWNDSRLTWSELTASHVPKLTYTLDRIWHPDIVLSNSLEPSKTAEYPATQALVLPSGEVSHVFPARLRFPCVPDLELWPRDTHSCRAQFGSWVHDSDALDLSVEEDGVQLNYPASPSEGEGNQTRGVWRVLSTTLSLHSQTDPCCVEEYPQVQLSVTVMRSDPSVAYTVQIPLIALSLLTGVVFLLPPAAVEKVVVGALCLVLDMQFLAYSAAAVPHSPSHIPLIVKLVSGQLVLTVAVVAACVLVVRLSRAPRPCPLPAVARRLVAALAAACCLTGYAAQGSPQSSECLKLSDMEEGGGGGDARGAGRSAAAAAAECDRSLSNSAGAEGRNSDRDSKDNILLGAIIDRFCFLLYFLIVGITMIACREVLF